MYSTCNIDDDVLIMHPVLTNHKFLILLLLTLCTPSKPPTINKKWVSLNKASFLELDTKSTRKVICTYKSKLSVLLFFVFILPNIYFFYYSNNIITNT